MTTGQQIFQDRIARLEKKHADNNGRPVAEQPPSGMDMAPSEPTPQARSKPRGGAARFIAVMLLAVIALPASAFFGTMFYQNNKDMILGMVSGAEAMTSSDVDQLADTNESDSAL